MVVLDFFVFLVAVIFSTIEMYAWYCAI